MSVGLAMCDQCYQPCQDWHVGDSGRTCVRCLWDRCEKYRAHLEVLRTDIDAARSYRENKGGQQVTCPPIISNMPPSVLAYLERLVRDALGAGDG